MFLAILAAGNIFAVCAFVVVGVAAYTGSCSTDLVLHKPSEVFDYFTEEVNSELG